MYYMYTSSGGGLEQAYLYVYGEHTLHIYIYIYTHIYIHIYLVLLLLISHVTRFCARCKQDGVYWKHGLCNNADCESNLVAVEHYQIAFLVQMHYIHMFLCM